MLALINLKDGHLKMSLFKQYQLIMNPCLSEATHTEKNNPGGQPKALWRAQQKHKKKKKKQQQEKRAA